MYGGGSRGRRGVARILLKEEDQFFFLPLLDKDLASLVIRSAHISDKKYNLGKPHRMCPNQLVFNYNCIIFPEIQKDQMIVCLKDTHHVRFIRYTYTLFLHLKTHCVTMS